MSPRTETSPGRRLKRRVPASTPCSWKFSDTNSAAVNAKSLSVTNSFQITVNEVNSPPVLGNLINHTVNPGQTISFTAMATDTDSPPNTLTIIQVSTPTGSSLEVSSVFLNWRPKVTKANTTNTVQIRVIDDGVPPLSDNKSFTVIVNPLVPVVLTTISYTNGQFTLKVDGTTGPDYIISASTNLTQWSDLITNFSPATPFQFSNTNINTFNTRFYRARLSP